MYHPWFSDNPDVCFPVPPVTPARWTAWDWELYICRTGWVPRPALAIEWSRTHFFRLLPGQFNAQGKQLYGYTPYPLVMT